MQVKLDPRFVSGQTTYSSRQLLLRLLNNLRGIYMTLNDAERALLVLRCVLQSRLCVHMVWSLDKHMCDDPHYCAAVHAGTCV
jgi:hypothetical protein